MKVFLSIWTKLSKGGRRKETGGRGEEKFVFPASCILPPASFIIYGFDNER